MRAILDNKKSHGLDALRGILAVVVCFAHSWQVFIAPTSGTNTWAGYVLGLSARFAVIWFFCLSGYVISLSISKNIHRHASFNSLEYAISRGFRVVPALIFVIFIVIILAAFANVIGVARLPDDAVAARAIFAVDIQNQLVSFLSLGALGDLTGGLNGPLWSLQYELQLYTIMGLAAAVLFGASKWLRILAILLLFGYLNYAFHLRSLSGSISVQILWFVIFGSGVLAYVYFREVSTNTLRVVSFFGVFICLIICWKYQEDLLSDMDSSSVLRLAQLAMGIGCTALIILLSRVEISKKWGELGRFGYTLYILHFPILLFVYFVLLNYGGYPVELSWHIAGLMTCLCIAVSYVLSFHIENAYAQRQFLRRIFGLPGTEIADR